jgi:copper(I)-binding protein
MKIFLKLVLFGTSLMGALALAQGSSVAVEKAWSRATAEGASTGAVYLILKNDGPADRLVAASAPVAERVELHIMSMEGGVMRMRELSAIEVPAQGTVEFKPGGLHLMLVGLKQPLKEGDRYTLTLKFEKAGTVQAPVTVAPLGATGHPDTHHKGH